MGGIGASVRDASENARYGNGARSWHNDLLGCRRGGAAKMRVGFRALVG